MRKHFIKLLSGMALVCAPEAWSMDAINEYLRNPSSVGSKAILELIAGSQGFRSTPATAEERRAMLKTLKLAYAFQGNANASQILNAQIKSTKAKPQFMSAPGAEGHLTALGTINALLTQSSSSSSNLEYWRQELHALLPSNNLLNSDYYREGRPGERVPRINDKIMLADLLLDPAYMQHVDKQVNYLSNSKNEGTRKLAAVGLGKYTAAQNIITSHSELQQRLRAQAALPSSATVAPFSTSASSSSSRSSASASIPMPASPASTSYAIPPRA